MHFSIFNNKTCKFLNIAHFLAESTAQSAIIAECFDYMLKFYGPHVFDFKRILLNDAELCKDPSGADKPSADYISDRISMPTYRKVEYTYFAYLKKVYQLLPEPKELTGKDCRKYEDDTVMLIFLTLKCLSFVPFERVSLHFHHIKRLF